MVRWKYRYWKYVAAGAVLAGSLGLAPRSSAQAPQSPPSATAQGGQQAKPPDKKDQPDKKDGGQRDVFDLPLEQLSGVQVRPSTPQTASGFDLPVSTVNRALDFGTGGSGTSATSTVGRSPAAVYVLTEEDIRRSGHRSIPELMRMVPGMDVARIDSNKWAVSARGFNDRFANKLLVLIDGRSVYTPLFAGTLWDERDVLLEDVERIEVIRGPGATLWGANAVNGVINIVTKNSVNTQGGMVVGGAGSEERAFGSLRYGGRISDDLTYRVYLKYFDRDQGVDLFGRQGPDAWHATRGGFRLDWTPTREDTFMLQADSYRTILHDVLTVPTLFPPFGGDFLNPTRLQGGYVLGRWTHVISEDENISLQLFWDRTQRRTTVFRELRDTYDLDFQHRFKLTPWQEIIYGFGYRVLDDSTRGTSYLAFNPASRITDQISFFAQDDVTLVKDRLHFIFGTKVENNDYVGWVLQPSGRFLWTPDEKQTVWGAISRAVRIPSRSNDDLRLHVSTLPPGSVFPGSPPTAVTFFGNRDFLSEELLAHEIGYRATPTKQLLLDVTGFFNLYENLLTSEAGTPFLGGLMPPHLVLPILQENRMRGETYGIETAVNWKVNDWWQLKAGYTWLRMHLHPDGSSNADRPDRAEGDSPQNQFHVRSFLDLPFHLKLDTGLYYVDSLPNLGIPSYVRLDVRLGWEPKENLELVVCLQNLLDPRHPEFTPLSAFPNPATQAERAIYGMVRWKF